MKNDASRPRRRLSPTAFGGCAIAHPGWLDVEMRRTHRLRRLGAPLMVGSVTLIAKF